MRDVQLLRENTIKLKDLMTLGHIDIDNGLSSVEYGKSC